MDVQQPCDLDEDEGEEGSVMDLSTAAGLPSTRLPRTESSLSRSAATSTASLASTESTSEKSSNNSVLQRSSSTTDVLNPHSETLCINDKVYVNGNKSGTIKFLGTTSFAPGQWAGVELEDTTGGKNDGSVNDVRYFECEPNRGIFVRPYRCTLQPIMSSRPASRAGSTVKQVTEVKTTTTTTVPSSVSSDSSGRTGSTARPAAIGNLRVGMRVIVNASSGPKVGTIRFLGPTEFAAGAWAGVELDVAAGKNDGTVAGKRYFTCPPNYGLFAPINKVQKYSENSGSASGATPTPGSGHQATKQRHTVTSSGYGRVGSGLSSSTRHRTGPCGSNESLTSVTSSLSLKSGSVAAAAARKRNNSGTGAGAGTTTTTSANSGALISNALQEVISEKEEHISQLLRERDMERGEVARAASKVDEMESRLESLRSEHQKVMQQKEEEVSNLKRCISEEHLAQKGLREQLDEEKRKLEVLEFKLEEEIVTRMELKDELDRLSRLRDMQSDSSAPSATTSMSTGRRSTGSTDREDDMFQLREELLRKEERIFELERNLETRRSEVTNLQKRVKEFENQVSLFDERQKNYLMTIDDLNLKLKKFEDQQRRFEEECVKHRDVKRKLEDQVSELIVLSSDSDLKSELKSKCEELETIRHQNMKLLKEVETSREAFKRLENNLQTELREKERRIEDLLMADQHLNIEIEKREDVIKELEEKIDELLNSSGDNSDQLAELSLENKQKGQQIKRLEEEICKLRNQIDEMDRNQENFVDECENMRRTVSEKDNEVSSYKQLETELRDRIAYLEDVVAKVKKQGSDDVLMKEKEITGLQRRVDELLKATGDSGTQLVAMNEELNQHKNLNANLSAELRNVKETLSRVEHEKQMLVLNIGDLKQSLKKSEEKVKELETKCNEQEQIIKRIKEEQRKLEMHLEDYQRRQDESSQHLDKLNEDNREKQLSIKKLKENIKELKEQLAASELEKRRLQSENAETKKNIADADAQLDELNRSLLETEANFFKEIHEIKDQVSSLQLEKERLISQIKSASDECQRLETVVIEKSKMISMKDESLDQLQKDWSMKVSNIKAKHDEERAQLMKKIEDLETAITFTPNGKSPGGITTKTSIAITNRNASTSLTSSTSTSLISNSTTAEEREQYEQQIDFLNSVIVDMQRKNDELRSRVQILQEFGDVTGFEEGAERILKMNGHRNNRVRMFCDICDVFDAHETEDCPQQANLLPEVNGHTSLSGHSKHGGDRRSERAYCASCEVFGHWTQDCDDNQSF